MPVFVLIRERGPNWDYSRGLREQDGWDEHAAFMDALAGEGSSTSAARSATTTSCT
jgi:hypothetical protein